MRKSVMPLASYRLAVLSLVPCVIYGFSSESCVIVGRTVDLRTGQPVARAEVELAALAGAQRQSWNIARTAGASYSSDEGSRHSTLSDDNGAFRFSSLRPGQYVLMGRKVGYLESPYRASSPSQLSAILNLREGQSAEVTLQLIPQSLISGKVTDGHGDPVDTGVVQLISAVQLEASVYHAVVKSAQVNDLGEYRIAGLRPGHYFLKFRPRESGTNPDVYGSVATEKSAVLVPTYHSYATTLREATPVRVGLGESVPGVDIVVRRTRTYVVDGVLKTADGAPEFASVSLVPDGEEPIAVVAGSGVLGAGGKFRFLHISPGDYNLYFVAGMGRGLSAGRVSITVPESDVVGLEINAAPPVTITGSVSVEDGDSKGIGEGRIRIVTTDLVIGPSYDATIQDDGSFELKDCSPGRYTIEVIPPKGFFVKTIRRGGLDISNAPLSINSSSEKLEVVLRRSAARLAGRSSGVSDGNEIAAGERVSLGAYFAVVAQERRISVSDIRFGYCDIDGAFVVDGLAPGRYRVLTLSSPDPGVFRNPSAVSVLGAMGTEINLTEGETATIVAPLLRREEATRLLNLGK